MAKANLIQLTPGAVKKATAGMSSGELRNIPVDALRIIPGFNVREKDADFKASVREYADSMKANGYDRTKPLAGFVFEDEADGQSYIGITDGHTRYEAVLLAIKEGAEIETIPVVTHPRGTSMEDITVALVTSNSGKQLKPFAVAQVCKRLTGYGMEPKEIAKRLSLTLPYVNQLLDLLSTPKALREMVSSGQVSATLAMETVKKHGKDASEVLSKGAEAAKAAGKDRVTAKHVKAVTALPKARKKAAPVAAQAPAEIVAQTPATATISVEQVVSLAYKLADAHANVLHATSGKADRKRLEVLEAELRSAITSPDTSFTPATATISDKENLLVLGAQWITDNSGDTTHRAMLAHLAGVSRKDVDTAIEELDPL